MTKQEAVQEFIDLVDQGRITGIIAKDVETTEYATHRTSARVSDTEIVVYSYAMFVNSSANLEVDDIARRF